jgi:riboflavin kinase/FMN adenylyltransferase
MTHQPHRRTSIPSPVLATRGVVERGDQRGRTIGFPTANIALAHDELLDGVWAGWVVVDSERQLAAISIGSRPTFYGTDGFRLLEAHLLDFAGDLYGRALTVVLWKKLRNQIRFGSASELVNQLHADVAACRHHARKADTHHLPRDLDHLPVGIATPIRIAS